LGGGSVESNSSGLAAESAKARLVRSAGKWN
jgi:hypothetical protein